MQVSCWYDYTCPYSWRMAQWLTNVRANGEELSVTWRTFSLKEANRHPSEPSPFADDRISSVSVLALALAHAAKRADFERYHEAVFAAMHVGGRRVEEDDLLAIALDADVDVEAFERTRPQWLDAVAADHRFGAEHHAVFGTPTVVHPGGGTAFVKLGQVPPAAEDLGLWRALCTLTTCHPELLEIKRPHT